MPAEQLCLQKAETQEAIYDHDSLVGRRTSVKARSQGTPGRSLFSSRSPLCTLSRELAHAPEPWSTMNLGNWTYSDGNSVRARFYRDSGVYATTAVRQLSLGLLDVITIITI